MERKIKERPLRPGMAMNAFEEINWQCDLSKKQFKVLRALRELRGGTVAQIAFKLGRSTSGVAHTLWVLQSKRKVVRTSYDEGDRTSWRLRTWADVDRDHIAEMARRGGVMW